jgi:germacradienol/geosmin synthase
MGVAARAALRQAVKTMLDSRIWELTNMAHNRIPDPVDYIEMRRRTFYAELMKCLSRLSHVNEIPAEVYRSRPVQALESCASDCGCLINDIYSFQKEIQFEGEIHNCVLVVQNFLNIGPAQAMGIVNDLISARVQEFEHVIGSELPVLFEGAGLDASTRAALTCYVEELRNWLAGVLHWHERCRRYAEAGLIASSRPALPTAQPGRPSGLGTSAARTAIRLRQPSALLHPGLHPAHRRRA